MKGNSKRHPHFGYLVFLIVFTSDTIQKAGAWKDDMFNFVSFEDTDEWNKDGSPYGDICSRKFYDTFREPRSEFKFNDLRAPTEALSPVRIFTEKALPSPEKNTLHIYNNPGVRRAYSMSYGLQRDKECIHGEDEECVVRREFGRVAAVAVTAERFKEDRNLNFIKDHFLIEDQEQFVTIINGGSPFERKFYEAVFLGGYPDREDPKRSSHQIDGKSYPMEIYMYFLDETVPAVPLTTILVVLVEESERDNPHVKPLVSTVLNDLYLAERKFKERNRIITRRQRLFHHLQKSTRYDINDIEGRSVTARTTLLNPIHERNIVQDTISRSVFNEEEVSYITESFERMQALAAELYFLDEDMANTVSRRDLYKGHIKDYNEKIGKRFFPLQNKYLFRLLYTGIHKAGKVKNDKENFRNISCETGTSDVYAGRHPNFGPYYLPATDPHYKFETNLSIAICEYLVDWENSFATYYKNVTNVKNMEWKTKYELIKTFVDLRKRADALDNDLHNHLFATNYNHISNTGTGTDQALEKERTKTFVKGSQRIFQDLYKRGNFERVITELQDSIKKIVRDQEFGDEKTMRDVIHFMKYGYKNRATKYKRGFMSKAMRKPFLPQDHKKHGLSEMGNMEIPVDTVVDENKISPIKAIVNQAFQISWLIPPHGGYYHYKGSSPIPPCFRAQNVIVFKHPITMSKHQIETLTRVPITFNKYQDIRNTVPLLNDLKFQAFVSVEESDYVRFEEILVPLYEEKRNQLFLGHDGVHLNSVEESEIWLAAQTNHVQSIHVVTGNGTIFYYADAFNFVEFDAYTYRRKLKESLYIRSLDEKMNSNKGITINSIWCSTLVPFFKKNLARILK